MPNLNKIRERVFRKYLKLGYDTLNQQERVFVCVCELEDEVNHGSFDAYYFNSSGGQANDAVEALRGIGALHTAELLRATNAIFGPAGPPRERTERQKQLLSLHDQAGERLSEPTKEFLRYRDDLESPLTAYVSNSSEAFELSRREEEYGVRDFTKPAGEVVDFPRLMLSHLCETSDSIRELLSRPAVAEVAAELWRHCEAAGENFEGRLSELIDSPEKLSAKLEKSVDAYEKFVRDPRLLNALLPLYRHSESHHGFSSLLMRFAQAVNRPS